MERRGGGEGEPQSLHPIVTPIRAPKGRSVRLSICLMRDVQMPPERDLHLTEPPGQT